MTITKSDPRFWAIGFSIILSMISAWQFFINVDGIYYLKAAEAFLNGTSHHGLRWPFYPILIAVLSKISGLSLLSSALIIQSILQVILVFTFINIIRLLGGSNTIQWLAAAVILLHPQLNEYRGAIIRDFGYWAFLLLSFYYLLRYIQTPKYQYCILWSVFILLATLFRIEGLVFIALAPLTLLLLPTSWKQRLYHVLSFYSLWILFGLVGIGFLLFHLQDVSLLGRLNDVSKWWVYFTQNFYATWETMQVNIVPALPRIMDSYTGTILAGGFLLYFITMFLSTLHPLFAGLAIFGQWKHALQNNIGRSEMRILYAFLLITLLIPVMILLLRWYITSRFVMTLVLFILFWVPFALYAVYTTCKESRFATYPWVSKIFVGIIGIALFIDGNFSYNSSGDLIKQASQWIQQHTPENAMLYSNSPQLAFYANRSGMDLSAQNINYRLDRGLEKNRWQQYDYLAIVVKRKKYADQELIAKTLNGKPIMTFENTRGDQVLVFSVCKNAITSRVTCSQS